MKYISVIEKSENNYSAYFPDISGCIATGKTEAEVIKNLTEALEFHLEGLALDNQAPPKAQAFTTYIVAKSF